MGQIKPACAEGLALVLLFLGSVQDDSILYYLIGMIVILFFLKHVIKRLITKGISC